MEPLFHLETDRVALTWSAARPRNANALPDGTLKLVPRRADLVFAPATKRAGVPDGVAHDPSIPEGPRLLEETDYHVYARAKKGGALHIRHRDPLIREQFIVEDGHQVVRGIINFHSQIGHSTFELSLDGEAELDFEVEVFPSKLDYKRDYTAILADVQEHLTALALEYLRSTYQSGSHVPALQATELEWVLLLRTVIDELERAVRHIARHPVRRLERRTTTVRAERVKRIDSRMRSALRRGAGSGGSSSLQSGLRLRERLPEQRPQPTLDTPEHRWLFAQLGRVRQRLSALRATAGAAATAGRPMGARRLQALADIATMEARVARLATIEPLGAASGEPPPGFVSLQLMTAPGYREAYRACLVLSLGLRIKGGPLDLGVKDLSLLYEYWCYLATLRILRELPGHSLDTRKLFEIRPAGLDVRLTRGAGAEIEGTGPAGRKITVQLGPSLATEDGLVEQQPDILISIADPEWSPLNLVLDAKYRVDTSDEYVTRHGAPGPPEDALNVLHRYRDAILAMVGIAPGTPVRTVVQAAAAFPSMAVAAASRSASAVPPINPAPLAATAPPAAPHFERSRLWTSLERIGVGAIPLLPDCTRYLEDWLRSNLSRGPWELSDKPMRNISDARAGDWRLAATESVLVGVLRSGDPGSHLEWIKSQRLYYIPHGQWQHRQFTARWVAIYSPARLRERGAVTHIARVAMVDVVPRRAIATPWPERHGLDDKMVLYHLEEVKDLEKPIENRNAHGKGQRFSEPRWSSRLAMARAQTISELLLETEPEWRLYEQFRLSGVKTKIEAGKVRVEDPEDPAGRAGFHGDGWRVRYTGKSGFELKEDDAQRPRYLTHPTDVGEAVQACVKRNASP